MRSLLLAISFLTIIPAYGNRMATDKEMADSLAFYPLVGFIIGGILAALAYLSRLLSLGVGGDALVIVLWIVLSGGLHLDGLMDTCDGLFSCKERERKLEIMRDSRVGAMGAIALAAILLLKFGFLTSTDSLDKTWVLMLAPAFGRCMMVSAIFFYPYARVGPGLGKAFAEQAGKLHMAAASVILLLGTFWLGGTAGLMAMFTAALWAVIITAWIGRVLRGQTGDTYGAVCEISETIFIITAVINTAVYRLVA